MRVNKEREERRKRLLEIVNRMPELPGCYQYLDEKGTVIYVGKAKRLQRRVLTYFMGEDTRRQVLTLVSRTHDIKYVVVKSEEDALLLENNLIKRYQPRYNVLLKDDKTYPSIAISNEPFPRIYMTRQTPPGVATYYGPYAHMPTMEALLALIKNLYHPRPCKRPITEKRIAEGHYKVCLDYHIENCGGVCAGKQSCAEYSRMINEAREILRGNTAEISNRMLREMRALAKEMRFEEAQAVKERYEQVELFRQKSEVVSRSINNIDVYNIENGEKKAYINYLHITNGSVNQAFTFEYKKQMNESSEELLALGIVEMRMRYRSKAREIIIPFPIDITLEGVTFTVATEGDGKKLLDLSHRNVIRYKIEHIKQDEKLNPEQRNVRMMKEIQNMFQLPTLPVRIELFDNSNLAGTDAVAACVVFEKLRPAKRQYRHYIIRTVTGPDDYASMQEVVRRRYTRAIEEAIPLPSLLITDGGKGQMEVVRRVVEDELHLKIPIVGLVKDGRHHTHEVLVGFPPATIGLRPESVMFRVLSKMQDEVHRFAIAFHRDRRSKRQTTSALDEIKGIGPKTKELLLKTFGSYQRICEASITDLIVLVGQTRGKRLYEKLREKEKKTEK